MTGVGSRKVLYFERCGKMYCNIIDPFKSVSSMGFGVQLKASNDYKFPDCAILCFIEKKEI